MFMYCDMYMGMYILAEGVARVRAPKRPYVLRRFYFFILPLGYADTELD